MSAAAGDFEALLRQALVPVDPPADLAVRVEHTLASLTELAHDELEGWEISAMGDPRNWARPAAAVAIGAGAGTALVLVRLRSSHRKRRDLSSDPLDLAERTLRDLQREARRVWRRN